MDEGPQSGEALVGRAVVPPLTFPTNLRTRRCSWVTALSAVGPGVCPCPVDDFDGCGQLALRSTFGRLGPAGMGVATGLLEFDRRNDRSNNHLLRDTRPKHAARA